MAIYFIYKEWNVSATTTPHTGSKTGPRSNHGDMRVKLLSRRDVAMNVWSYSHMSKKEGSEGQKVDSVRTPERVRNQSRHWPQDRPGYSPNHHKHRPGVTQARRPIAKRSQGSRDDRTSGVRRLQ